MNQLVASTPVVYHLRPLHTGAHLFEVTCLALSPDNGQLLTGSEDKYLRVWDIEWELLSNDPVSALSAQFRKPPAPSGLTPMSGFMRMPKPQQASGEIRPDDMQKPRPSIFLDGRKGPKG